MHAHEIDWRSGTVLLWSLDRLDAGVPLDEQRDRLDEEMARVKFPDGARLEAGWNDGDGASPPAFSVVVVRGPAWDEPVFRARCSGLESLREALAEAAAHTHATRAVD